MNKIIIALCLLCFNSFSQSATNVLVAERMQWSTNAIDWNDDDNDLEGETVDLGPEAGLGFFKVDALPNVISDSMEGFMLTTYWGTNAGQINTPILTNEVLVYPTVSGPVDLFYKPVLLITNITPFVFVDPGTNELSTNLPTPP